MKTNQKKELKMKTYFIYNKADDERYYKIFENYEKCYWWVVDNLDLSKKWETSIKRNTLYSKITADLSYFIRTEDK